MLKNDNQKNIKLSYYDFEKSKKEEIIFSSFLIKEEFDESSLYVIKIKGESMQNLIMNDSLIVASLNIGEIKNNSIYIIEHDKQIWIKKAKITNNENKFISINPKYLHLEYKFEDVRIIAKALLTFTSL